MRQIGIPSEIYEKKSGALLKSLLSTLATSFQCSQSELELHHNPALVNRPFNKKTGRYTPDANDPEHLEYMPKPEHDIRTRVRGESGQYSDLAFRRKLKRIEENRQGKPKRKIPQRKNAWPKGQTFRSRPK